MLNNRPIGTRTVVVEIWIASDFAYLLKIAECPRDFTLEFVRI
jgi:hypothetical protein